MNFTDICNEWKNNGRLPVVSGITYCDGYVDRIYIEFDKDNNYKRTIVKEGRIDIDSLSANEKKYGFSHVGTFCEVSNKENNINVYCGGGSYGGEGFIVVESNEKIIWIAFFTESNEFLRCEIVENSIIAYNNSREKWVFDIDNPSDFSIHELYSNPR